MGSLWVKPAYSLAFVVLAAPAVTWGTVGAFGGHAWTGLIAGFGVSVWTYTDRNRAYGGRAERRRIATAIQDHRDHGFQHRRDVDSEARHLVSRGTQAVWIGPLILAALGAVILGAAFLGDHRVVAVPALMLFLSAGVNAAMMRRAVAEAAWWLAAPPPSTEAAAA